MSRLDLLESMIKSAYRAYRDVFMWFMFFTLLMFQLVIFAELQDPGMLEMADPEVESVRQIFNLLGRLIWIGLAGYFLQYVPECYRLVSSRGDSA